MSIIIKEQQELLEVYDLKGNLIELKLRSEFYNEIEEEFASTGAVTKKVKSIRVLLMNSSGKLYLQKRSNMKSHNKGLYDKTIGGHFMSGHTWEMTVVREMVEELGIPSVVLPAKDFSKAIKTTDLSIIGIFKEVDYDPNFSSTRTAQEGSIVQPFMNTFYIGYYDGSIKFQDGEASGIEVYSLSELDADIVRNPERYTQDLKTMIVRFRKYLIPADLVE